MKWSVSAVRVSLTRRARIATMEGAGRSSAALLIQTMHGADARKVDGSGGAAGSFPAKARLYYSSFSARPNLARLLQRQVGCRRCGRGRLVSFRLAGALVAAFVEFDHPLRGLPAQSFERFQRRLHVVP
jgi:hypothetical protein